MVKFFGVLTTLCLAIVEPATASNFTGFFDGAVVSQDLPADTHSAYLMIEVVQTETAIEKLSVFFNIDQQVEKINFPRIEIQKSVLLIDGKSVGEISDDSIRLEYHHQFFELVDRGSGYYSFVFNLRDRNFNINTRLNHALNREKFYGLYQGEIEYIQGENSAPALVTLLIIQTEKTLRVEFVGFVQGSITTNTDVNIEIKGSDIIWGSDVIGHIQDSKMNYEYRDHVIELELMQNGSLKITSGDSVNTDRAFFGELQRIL